MTNIPLSSEIEKLEAQVDRLRGNIAELETALAERHERFGDKAEEITAGLGTKIEEAKAELVEGEAELVKMRRTARGKP